MRKAHPSSHEGSAQNPPSSTQPPTCTACGSDQARLASARSTTSLPTADRTPQTTAASSSGLALRPTLILMARQPWSTSFLAASAALAAVCSPQSSRALLDRGPER